APYGAVPEHPLASPLLVQEQHRDTPRPPRDVQAIRDMHTDEVSHRLLRLAPIRLRLPPRPAAEEKSPSKE
ncbi:hypothetical protein LINPERPRIM_LOCUS20341, partial [Linum perenne]